ncbi:MAG: YceI family protein [Bacteriovoracaceae bacterium]|jgi:hypothetical protein|nr:YceI family protein [Bacteriovoracaceae bacterium]
MKYIFILIIFTHFALAKNCIYKIEAQDIEANWTAFKTPAKVGVSGRFKSLGLKKEIFSAASIKEAITGVSFNINTMSTWTRNNARDAKIIKFFFSGHKDGFKITGKINKIKNNKLHLDIKMNGVSKTVPMNITQESSIFRARGTIDIFDFGLHSSLAKINKACQKLHQGKTWNDVDIELKINFDKTCK